MKILSVTILAAALSVASFSVFAGDPEAGKAKARACAGCHGANGISNSPMWPNLAGQKEAYLAGALQMYKDGRRANAMMAPMAKGLSDTDIANLAAYYSSLK